MSCNMKLLKLKRNCLPIWKKMVTMWALKRMLSFDEDNKDVEDDGVGDMWNEMSLAKECAKVTLSACLMLCF